MSVIGNFDITLKSIRGKKQGGLYFKMEDEVLKGILDYEERLIDIEDLKVDGGKFTGSFPFKSALGDMQVMMKGVVEGDTVTGAVEAGIMKIKINGTRVE